MGIHELGLLVIAGLIPVVGFVIMLGYARKGSSRREQRWRKHHGLLFWVLIPGIAGVFTVLGTLEILPRIFALVGIATLGFSTLLSRSIQAKREGSQG